MIKGEVELISSTTLIRKCILQQQQKATLITQYRITFTIEITLNMTFFENYYHFTLPLSKNKASYPYG